MVYGDGEMGAEQETLGMCARRLRVVVRLDQNVPADVDATKQDRAPTARWGPKGLR